MFNLEQAIADWRRQMLAAGIKSPVPLEELEGHLREEFQEQVQTGVNEEQAFACAVQKIGHARVMTEEFQKANETKNILSPLVKKIGFGGALIVFCGPLLGPALAIIGCAIFITLLRRQEKMAIASF